MKDDTAKADYYGADSTADNFRYDTRTNSVKGRWIVAEGGDGREATSSFLRLVTRQGAGQLKLQI